MKLIKELAEKYDAADLAEVGVFLVGISAFALCGFIGTGILVLVIKGG